MAKSRQLPAYAFHKLHSRMSMKHYIAQFEMNLHLKSAPKDLRRALDLAISARGYRENDLDFNKIKLYRQLMDIQPNKRTGHERSMYDALSNDHQVISFIAKAMELV